MRTSLEMRKPAGQGELREFEIQNSSRDFDNSETLHLRQAARIINRFNMSVPLALATARLAYGGAA